MKLTLLLARIASVILAPVVLWSPYIAARFAFPLLCPKDASPIIETATTFSCLLSVVGIIIAELLLLIWCWGQNPVGGKS